MSRLAPLVFILIATPAFATPPSAAEIQQAVRELGDKRFAVREKASKFLWMAGEAAEAALKEAEKTRDPETARRARDILDRFAWGVFPDTPKPVADLIAEYRAGDQAARMAAVKKLVPLGRPGYTAIKRLAGREDVEENRRRIFAEVAANAQRGVPAMLLADDLAGAEELLDLCLAADNDTAPTNYAAFQYLRGTLPAAIKKWDGDWASTRTKLAGEVLIHLYRAKGDFAAARKIADELKNEDLIDALLWEQGDWKALAERAGQDTMREGLSLGARAGYQRLAGDVAGFEKTVAALRKLGEGTGRYDVKSAAEALLLNGRPDEAIAFLTDKNHHAALAFELLCSRMQFKEALALAHDARGLEGEDLFYLELRRARSLYLLGQKDQALQIYNKLGEGLKEIGQTNVARDLLRGMVRQGLKDQAAEVCANYIAVLDGKGIFDGLTSLLEPLFDDDAESALVWFHFLHQREKEPTAAAAMKTVRALFAGKPVPKRDEWAAELFAAAYERQLQKVTDPVQPAAALGGQQERVLPARHITPADRVASGLAAGTVMLAAGNDKLAEEYFNKAATANNTTAAAVVRYGDFLAENKRFKEAAGAYAKAAAIEPGQALALFLQGWAEIQAGEVKKGKRLTELAHWLPLGGEGLRGDFAQELEKRGFADHARRERDLVLTIGWYRYWHVGNVINHASRMALQKKDFARAIALLEKGIVGSMRMGASFVEPQAYLVIPESVSHYRARQLLNEGKADEALKRIRAVLDVLPGQLELVIETAPALEKAGRKADADELFGRVLSVYERMCEEYPESAFAHNSLAWLCANCRRRLDLALTHAQTAVKLEPKAAGYLDTLAEVHFRRGDKEKAAELMKQCRTMEPKAAYYRKQLERFEKGDVSADVPEHDD